MTSTRSATLSQLVLRRLMVLPRRARWSKLEETVSTGAATWEGNTVSLGQIDGQLQRLWNAADTEWDGDGPRPDIRTSVLNLIAYAPDEACCERTTMALEQLSGTHPSRAIIIVPGNSHAESSIDCRMSIHSHGAYAEYRQVCSEQQASVH